MGFFGCCSWKKYLIGLAIVLGLAGGLRFVQISAKAQSPTRQFSSKVITSRSPGHKVDIEVDITGAKKLFLVVTDGGDGFSCDWADWIEPRLLGPKGETKLTDLKWRKASSDWGQVQKNRNAGGGTLRVAGKAHAFGIGTHANSVIVFDLPAGFTKFKTSAGLDDGGTNQNNGQTSSAQFHVFVDKMPLKIRPPQGGAGREPGDAIAGLDVGEGMEATLFAAEPNLLSPTNIDIDAKGRVWVCEVVNYRGRNGTRKDGDRILILEDTDGDGKADKTKVYYQGRDIDSAMGICVLGNKVIVSCSPNVWVFTDENGDDIPDKKEVLFTRTGQPQHDHSAHAFIFGPDGRLYWNFGNTGHSVHDKDGKPVIDMAGNTVNNQARPYREGMAFRCDMEGKNFEVLGHNFRNNYEVTIDSFGTLWQSDNDDDGNRGVRINYVMEYGNFGYTDEITGAGWRSPRTNMEKEVPLQHWHLNDPGVVPNLLQTGAGSPTGICVYEGNLLPRRFWGQVIHADAGPNVVRAYPVKNAGAGYSAHMDNILVGARDNWFRPSDVCVAPDGSLFIADWYDPGVGGHGMGDIDRGRIFRIAPPKTAYKIPTYDYSTPEGAVKALENPALSVRYLAWDALQKMGARAEPALRKMAVSNANPRFRARALWILGQLQGKGSQAVELAIGDKDSDLRIVGVRLARELKLDILPIVGKLVRDPSPQVRRECIIALRGNKFEEASKLWAELASQHDGQDRWYLEALGIGANQQWDEYLGAWLARVGSNWNTPGGRDILWRSRAEKTPEYLVKIIEDPKTSKEELPRYLRAFDFLTGKNREEALIQLAFASPAEGDKGRLSFIMSEAISRLKNFDINSNPQSKAALNRVLEQTRGTPQFVKLVEKFRVESRYPELLELAQKNAEKQMGVDAISVLLAGNQTPLIRAQLLGKDAKVALATATALTTARDSRASDLLLPLLDNTKMDLEVRRQAVRALAGFRQGAQELVKKARAGKLDPKLKEAAAAVLHQVQWRDIKTQVAKIYPLPASKNNRPLPTINDLLAMRGDSERGLKIFRTTGTCANCHIVNKFGKEVGPDLSEIGGKLSRQALFESILFPSAAISHNYESYAVALKSGNIETGLLVSKTPEAVTIKGADSILRTFKTSEIDEFLRQPISLMPADLTKLISEQELVDVVDYLITLRKSAQVQQKR